MRESHDVSRGIRDGMDSNKGRLCDGVGMS